MPRKKVEHKYHFIYKTTNLKNGKFYVGMHSTSNLNDGYLGSGDRLRRAIRKHGKENFKLEILEFFENREQLASREKELVNEDFLKDPMCMNLVLGGQGGILSKQHNINLKIGASKYQKERWKDDEYRKKITEILKSNMILNHKQGKIKYNTTKGKNISTEHKLKISEANKIKQKGLSNSQYGTFWITNGVSSKKIKSDELIPEGWYKGRKICL